ncbi:MAG TPA: LytTR family DNA-binding domain-containing protein, partial [Gammaproteobacteria bacterium]|nr:LytTR family DNA-binding domain-containing protein [Gammaproteobacteria bacterium]
EIVAECAQGREVSEKVAQLQPDAVFLDASLPFLSGLELVRPGLVSKRPYAVITSSSADYALRAFELQAIDYLLVPFSHERLKATLLRLRKWLELELRAERNTDIDSLLRQLKAVAPKNDTDRSRGRVPIKFGTRYRFLNMSAMRYILAQRDYVDIHMQTDEVLHANDRISEIERKLPTDRFIRVHRSVIINIQHVKEVRSSNRNYEIVMNNNQNFSVGTTYKTKVKKTLLTAQDSMDTFAPLPPMAVHA